VGERPRRILSAGDGDERALSTDSTTHRRLRTLTIELGEPRVFEVDGDDLGEATHIDISVQPAAIRVR
jgi:diacylglycerol kinase (ATP)